MSTIRKTIGYLYVLCTIFFFSISSVYARDLYCNNSIKNNLWIGAPFSKDTRALQKYLNTKGFALPVTGGYWKKTELAVKSLQATYGMEQTGQFGFMTRTLVNQDICHDPIENFNPKKEYVPEFKETQIKEQTYLEVPLIEQRYRLSCEAASMQMSLAYKGITKGQDELLKLIGVSKPFKRQFSQGQMIWGDPDVGFVGDVRGYVYTYPYGFWGATGWGVNNGPVAKVLQQFLPNTAEIDGVTLEQIKTELKNKNPVIFWHKDDTSLSERISYKTLEGKDISFTSTHVAVIIGFSTDINNKTQYFINDPVIGRLVIDEDTLSRWMSRWNHDVVAVK